MLNTLRSTVLLVATIVILLGSSTASAMYDPGTGRFLQRDPSGYPDGHNQYAAYHVMRGAVDPSGMYEADLNENVTSVKKLAPAEIEAKFSATAYSQLSITEIKLEIIEQNVDKLDKKMCCVKVKSVDWTVEIFLPTKDQYIKHYGLPDWKEYEKLRDKTNAEWYYNRDFIRPWEAVSKHEWVHDSQIRKVFRETLKKKVNYINSLTDDFAIRFYCKDTLEEAKKVKAREQETLSEAWRKNFVLDFASEFKVGDGFKKNDYGENEAVEVERGVVEEHYQDWLRQQ